MLLYHPRKGEIAAKMEKSKNDEVKTAEESLRMKLHRLKQEIREMGERGIEVELATAAAQAKSAALDAELATKMARYVVLNEETVAMRKEHDAFNNDITMRLQKLHGKYPFFNQEATNSGPEGTGPESPKFPKRKSSNGDNNEEIDLTDVVVAQPVLADQKELILQLMQQIAEMRVEMQRKQDLPSPIFAVNAQPNGRPPAQIPPPNVEQAQNPPSSPARNPSIIDLTTQNPHYASASYQTPPPPQNTNLQAPLPSSNANHQTGLPPQSQNVNRPHISLHHQNQHTNPQIFPQNYQATQNAQSPSISPPLPQKSTFQIPVPNEHDAHGSELDHYEERERVEVKGRDLQDRYEGGN
ncbi:uncharacterized protein [Solanum tuberosum]|uniref:uncharacterized protein n=1 Tax=Solanum tuberosum TaxID=4113 RepID=UPI000739FDAB|nr:PREDICTED: uncharacterized protein LOC107059045 [Solanum tuberosum]